MERSGDQDFSILDVLVEFTVGSFLVRSSDQLVTLFLKPLGNTELVLDSSQESRLLGGGLSTIVENEKNLATHVVNVLIDCCLVDLCGVLTNSQSCPRHDHQEMGKNDLEVTDFIYPQRRPSPPKQPAKNVSSSETIRLDESDVRKARGLGQLPPAGDLSPSHELTYIDDI